MGALWLGLCVWSAASGAVPIPSTSVLAIALESLGLPGIWEVDEGHRAVVMSLRLPRIALASFVGAALALGGAVMQGLFRNPLAAPGLVGVSTGAALFAALFIVLGTSAGWLYTIGLPGSAFIGATLVCVLVFQLSTVDGVTSVTTMLLAGIAINALSGALTGILVFVADDAAIRNLTFWSLGSLGGATWQGLQVLSFSTALPAFACLFLAGPLNALLLGEAEAGHLGVNVEQLKRFAVLLVALMVGSSVATTGVIGFVGLVVPHLCRLALGPDHRTLLPASLLAGPALLVGADVLSRTIVAPAELPIGIVTTVLGSPFFLWLLLRSRGGAGGLGE
ncbi:MAG: iron ABC transporter permease [Myxococcota bacterium]